MLKIIYYTVMGGKSVTHFVTQKFFGAFLGHSCDCQKKGKNQAV
jgi:hypothetical protein